MALADGGSAGVPDGGANQSPLTGIASLQSGDGYSCGVDGTGNVWCWGVGVGYVPEAVPFVNPGGSGGVPSGPVTSLSSFSSGGYESGIRYITAGGQYIVSNQIVTQVCP
jgi:hypothetical protein